MDSLKWEHVVANLSVPAKPTGLWTLAIPYVAPFTVVKIIAAGTWTYTVGETCGPDGARKPTGALTPANCLDTTALVGSLVGKIGSGSADQAGTMFGVGGVGVFSVPEDKSGALFLTINDEIAGMDDNSGALTVQVFVANPPPPPAKT